MAILGIDEVGRGPLAGPLVVGAVVLPVDADGNKPEWVKDLRDSKKLSGKKREELSTLILDEAATGLGWVSNIELDKIGMTEALKLAARKAVEAIQKKRVKFTEIIIDGNLNFFKNTPLGPYTTTVIKGDDLIKEISAASIIAKVARDKYMAELSQKYPEYGWDKNAGYGTKLHRDAILKYGVTPEHRLSFEPCKSLVGFKKPSSETNTSVVKNTTLTGLKGETAVCEFLELEGHKIIARNFKTKVCEIDIVSVRDDTIYFTEVKTRKNADYGGGVAAVDKKKLEKMKLGVEMFLKARPSYKKYNPLLAVATVDGSCQVTDFIVLS